MTTVDDGTQHEPTAQAEASSKRPRGMRRAVRGFANVLIVAGILLLADAGLTVVWQEPMSAAYNHFQQSELSGELEDLGQAVIATPAEKRALASLPDDSRRIAFAARALDRKADDGQAVGRIRIPAIGVSKVIVQGTNTDDLHKGPGHYPNTPLPGAPGTVGVAGHRTTYGAPFRHVDKLKRGDVITMQMPYATITYQVERLRIVPPTATWVVDRRSYDRLVLTACHPLYSAAKRIVVFAKKEREVASKALES